MAYPLSWRLVIRKGSGLGQKSPVHVPLVDNCFYHFFLTFSTLVKLFYLMEGSLQLALKILDREWSREKGRKAKNSTTYEV